MNVCEYSPIGQMRNTIEFLPLQKVGGQVLAMIKGGGGGGGGHTRFLANTARETVISPDATRRRAG